MGELLSDSEVCVCPYVCEVTSEVVPMFFVTSSGLSQDQLILLAFFTGSDYTEGVQGVGVVSAVEILRDFPGKGMEVLQKFRYVCYRE